MAVDVSINGAPVWNTAAYSVQEDATPIDVTSTQGGSPTFSLSTNFLPGDKSLSGLPVVITDGSEGRIQGKITGLSSQGNLIQINGFTNVSLLNTVVKAAPFSGTLSGAVAYLLGLIGLGLTSYQIDTTIASRVVTLRGFNDNLQDYVKALCAAQQIEMSYVDSIFVFRPIRQNVAQIYRNSDNNFTIANDSQAQQLSIVYYNGVQKASGLAYPLTQPDRGSDIQQVSDGQTITVNLRFDAQNSDSTGLGVSLASVQQPSCVDSVDEGIIAYSGGSVYSIIDSNNNVYPAANWISRGGSVVATVDDDSLGVTLTITGPSDSLGPYRLAATNDSGSTFYTTLRLIGSGVFFNKKLLIVPTGLTPLDTGNIQPPVVDNFAINTIGDAYSAVLSSLRNVTGPSQAISVTTKGINTGGKTGEYTLMTFAQWDAIWGGGTFAAWDSPWSGKSFQQYDDYLFSLVRGKFANQAFGNVGGARVLDDNSWYRITTGTISEGSVRYKAVADNTFQDWDNVWSGKTFAQWDSAWGGRRFIDYSPYILSPGATTKQFYFMSSSNQDFSRLSGLGYEHLPNDPSFRSR